MLKLIMALSKRNRLTNIHPAEKTMLSLMPIIIMGFAKNPFVIIGNLLFFALLHCIVKNNRKIVIKFSIEIALFAAFSSITLIFQYGYKYVIVIILKSLSAGLCLSFFSLTTPIDQVLWMMSKINALKDICDIAKSMERFLIVMNDEYNIMLSAMKSRGGFGSFSSKINSTGKMAALLFVNTMERWKSIKDGINSRCYKGYMPYIQNEFDFVLWRFLLICGYDLILIFAVAFVNYYKIL